MAEIPWRAPSPWDGWCPAFSSNCSLAPKEYLALASQRCQRHKRRIKRKHTRMVKIGMERVSSPPVLLVIALICLVYYTVVFLVIGEWLGMSSAPGLFNALCFSWITFMAIISYGFCIFRDPGKVPLSYMPDVEDDRVSLHEVKRKVTPFSSSESHSLSSQIQSQLVACVCNIPVIILMILCIHIHAKAWSRIVLPEKGIPFIISQLITFMRKN